MPVSSARISLAEARSPPKTPTQDGIEEEHRVRAERPVRPAGLEEMDGRPGQAAQLDLAGDLLDELVALLLGRLVRRCSCRGLRRSTRCVGWSAALKAW